jgi:hypothetical protein
MRSLIVAIKDELNEGNFLGTGAGFDAAANRAWLYPAPQLTASLVCGEKDCRQGRVSGDNQY